MLIAIGSNLPAGDKAPETIIESALQLLEESGSVDVTAVSRLWRTPAVPADSGPDFVNAAAAVETALSPAAMLERLHAVEARAGRVRTRRWGPRTLDLDLIAAGDAVLPDRATEEYWRLLPPEEAARRVPPCLVMPHPRMAERAFVLAPLAEIAPDWRHPVLGLTVAEMLAARPEAERSALRPIEPGRQCLRTALLAPPDGRDALQPLSLAVHRLPGTPGVELHRLAPSGTALSRHRHLAEALATAEAEFGLAATDWRPPEPPAESGRGRDGDTG